MSSFVAQSQELIAKASGDYQSIASLPRLTAPHVWMEADAECLASLRALCLGQHVDGRPGPGMLEAKPFVALLEAHRRQPQESFRLLAERYAYPLNITLEGEEEIREYLLMRLMVQDRVRLLKHSVREMDTDELLLKLNLLAVHAALSPDLRYLDALNYYYELLPAEWETAREHAWLSVSYLTLYAHALAAQVREESECA
jgi:diadenosine tetraphosphatase ApaH/serine/threonine PP2A family protein phosphatase